MPIDVTSLLAEPGFAPRKWQSHAPAEAYGGHKPPVASSPDLTRIRALPRRPQLNEGPRAEAMVELISARFRLPSRVFPCECRKRWNRACITELKPAQAWALYEIGLVGGLLGPIGVGHGKTILDLLTPLAIRDCKLALLLIPPGLVSQIIDDYELVGQHFKMPSMVVHGSQWGNINPGMPVLHVYPYSRLSRHESTTFLEAMKPDVIIADEVHKLRHADTATTSRVLRYFAGHPNTRFCGWSGSITDSSVKDYAHLAALALRERSPLPLDPEVVEDWARALDPGDWPAPAGALLSLCDPGESVQSGFHRRLVESLGVVATTAASVSTELVIAEKIAPTIPEAVGRALNDVRGTWVRPDGEELIDALTVARCLRELACGFYYRWIFPRGEPDAVIREWLKARQEWHRELRDKLRSRVEHLDSPLLCKHAAQRAHGDRPIHDDLPVWKSQAWPRWRDVESSVQPESEAVRLHPYLAEDAAAWGHAHKGIIWYESRAFGVWVAEISGLPMHAGGPDAGKAIGAERGDRSIVASIKAHGTGRDGLQRLFAAQLVAQPPSSATAWEQLLGRLHRIGQEAPSVRAEFYRHTEELRTHVDSALRKALYVQGTLGATQKLSLGFLE